MDPTFAGGGSVSLGFTAEAVALQSDGKILVAGLEGASPAGGTRAVLERLNADGSLDPTFAGGMVLDSAEANEGFYGVVVQADGKVVASGTSNGRFLLARYNVDGTLDSSFGTGGRVTTPLAGAGGATAYSLALNPSTGGIDVAGGFVGTGGQLAVVAFTSSGAVDANFNHGAPLTLGALAPGNILGQIVVRGDGKIVGAGDGGGGNVFVTRLNADGTLDATFNPGGTTPGLLVLTDLATQNLGSGIPDTTEGLALDGSGNILVANRTASGHFGTVRIKADGSRDATFGAAGLVTTDFGGSDDADVIGIQPDGGQIVVAGTTTSAGVTQTALAAYHTDGTPDTSFGVGGKEVFDSGLPVSPAATPADARRGGVRPNAQGIGAIVEKVVAALQPDGRLLVGASQMSATRALSTIRRLNVLPAATGLPTGTLAGSISANIPPAVVSGAKAKAKVSVTVTAPADKAVNGPVTITLYVSQTQSLAGATSVATVTKKLKLKAGRSKSLKIKLSAFPAVNAGTYFLLAGVQAPDNTLTGVASQSTVMIAPAFVKVVASGLLPLPASAAPGKRTAVSLTLQDAGNIPAAGTATLTVSATSQGGAAQMLASVPVKVKLKPNSTKTFKVKFVLPATLAAGTYTLAASLGVGTLGDNTASDGVTVSSVPLVVP